MNSKKHWSNSIRIITIMLTLMVSLFTFCSSALAAETEAPEGSASVEETDRVFYAHVNGTVLKILAAGNSSADAFLELFKTGDMTIDMHDYGGFEKVGPLGTEIVRSDEDITTTPGDIILYLGSNITIYYDVNRWDFTLLGHIDGATGENLRVVLGEGNPSVKFSLPE